MPPEFEGIYYPRATCCAGPFIVTLLWFRPSIRSSVCSLCFNFVNTLETVTIVCRFIKLGRHVHYDEKMNPIDFGGQRSRSQLIYGRSQLAHMEISLKT